MTSDLEYRVAPELLVIIGQVTPVFLTIILKCIITEQVRKRAFAVVYLSRLPVIHNAGTLVPRPAQRECVNRVPYGMLLTLNASGKCEDGTLLTHTRSWSQAMVTGLVLHVLI